MRHISFLFDGISFDARSIHVLCSRHNNRCKQSVPSFPLYMLWDSVLTSYTINSLPVRCSTNKLLKTWLGKAKYFCIHYNSKTKQKPGTKIQSHIFLLHWRPHAKVQALSRKFIFSPKSSLSMVLHSPLQLYDYTILFRKCSVSSRQFYSCLLSDHTFKWQRRCRWPCFDTDLTAFVA